MNPDAEANGLSCPPARAGVAGAARPGSGVVAALIAVMIATGSMCPAAAAADFPPSAVREYADTLTKQQWSDSLAELDLQVESGCTYEEAESTAVRLTCRAVRERGETSREALVARFRLIEALMGDRREPDAATLALILEGTAWAVRAKQTDPARADSMISWMDAALATLLLARGDDDAARAPLDRVLGGDSTGFWAILCYHAMANRLMRQNDLARAQALMERALELIRLPKNLPGQNEPERMEASILANLATLEMMQGNQLEARRDFERAQAIADQTMFAGTHALAMMLTNFASNWYCLGELDRAASCLDRALAIQKRCLRPDHPDLYMTVNNAAAVALARGDLPRAGDMLREQVLTIEFIHGPAALELVAPLKNLGQLDLQLGGYEESRRLLLRALHIEEAQPDSDGLALASTLVMLGDLSLQAGAYGEARRFFLRSLGVHEAWRYGRRSETISTLNNLADLYVQTDSLDQAEAYYDRARALVRATRTLRARPAVARTGAAIALARGRVEEAAALLDSVEAAVTATLPPLHPDLADYLGERSRVSAAQGDRVTARATALRASDLLRKHLLIVAHYLPEWQAMTYAARCRQWLDFALGLSEEGATGGPARALFDGVIRSRGVVQDEMTMRRRALHLSADPGLRGLADSLGQARERLAYAYLAASAIDSATSARQRMRIERAAADKEQLERELADRGHASWTERGAGPGADEVTAALPERGVLVSYYRVSDGRRGAGVARSAPGAEDRYIAFVLARGDTAPALVALGPAADIDSLVARWRRRARPAAGISQAVAFRDCEEAGQRLCRAIWDPVRTRFADARRVFVVPDAALNLVSFDALPTGARRFVAEEPFVIHFLNSERDLVREADPASPTGSLLAVGAPDFDRANGIVRPLNDDASSQSSEPVALRGPVADCGSLRETQFVPLPGARLEAREIASLWHGVSARRTRPADLLIGGSATEAEFKRLAPGRSVLHVATHGYFLDEECAARSVPFAQAPGGEFAIPTAELVRENPLLLSGLAFAGANRRAGARDGATDGMLTAEEIAALDLDGTQWVVLSACGTGLGAVRAGEGILGLKRAFQVAGAGTVISSLWPVGDVRALLWMRRLYLERGQGRSTMDAVHVANLAALRRLRERGELPFPALWGAFVATGDWR